jgi:hypothetical protein
VDARSWQGVGIVVARSRAKVKNLGRCGPLRRPLALPSSVEVCNDRGSRHAMPETRNIMPDMQAATALKLYIDNDGTLYRQMTTSILKNLAAKKARGQYKHDLAVKGFGYLTEAGAKKYTQEFGSGPWHKAFDVATRKRAAEALTKDFETEYALGNYDALIPKKYQKQAKGSAPIKPRYPQGDEGRDKPYHGPSEDYPRSPARGHARKKLGQSRSRPVAEKSYPRVEILESGGSKYFRPGQFGYVIGSTSRGGMHTLDHGDSREGDLTYLVSKTKGIGGGALWFSPDALRFTGRGEGAGSGMPVKDRSQIAREVEAVVGKIPSYRGVR